ncbi:hypothetical protein [Streptomyces sp. NPDC058665]|uniref:hypothetical protein n=1 Tax=Streptomyces sp. NPDC058665 TaxID=3346586 RepID=UPI003648A1E9
MKPAVPGRQRLTWPAADGREARELRAATGEFDPARFVSADFAASAGVCDIGAYLAPAVRAGQPQARGRDLLSRPGPAP